MFKVISERTCNTDRNVRWLEASCDGFFYIEANKSKRASEGCGSISFEVRLGNDIHLSHHHGLIGGFLIVRQNINWTETAQPTGFRHVRSVLLSLNDIYLH